MGSVETLSDVPHVAIRQAVEDLEKCRADGRYEIDMGHWHEPIEVDDEKCCAVCFAGSVMAQRLGADPDEWLNPDDFPGHEEMLLFLDEVRLGAVTHASLSTVGWTIDGPIPDFVWQGPSFSLSRWEEWKAHMLHIADWLEEHARPIDETS